MYRGERALKGCLEVLPDVEAFANPLSSTRLDDDKPTCAGICPLLVNRTSWKERKPGLARSTRTSFGCLLAQYRPNDELPRLHNSPADVCK